MHAAATSGAGVLQKLARVFKEKAAQDLGRIVKGTSKTREKLGVGFCDRYSLPSPGRYPGCTAAHPLAPDPLALSTLFACPPCPWLVSLAPAGH